MIIFALETSCDETAASILEEKNGSLSVLSNIVSSQVKLHSKWGGVVPNLAAREHLKNILPVINEALKEAKKTKKNIDLIAVTNGPGLIPALLIGVETAKTLAYFWKKPLLGIHHIEGHIYANFVNESSKFKVQNSKLLKNIFPILCLVVSGGHTQLILMKKHLDYEIIGETLDDAAGEAFDKVARILNLGYPGGPIISAKAEIIADQHRQNTGKRGKIQCKSASSLHKSARQFQQLLKLPRPMINSNNFNFSFSGLKTAVLYLVKKNEKLLKNEKFISSVCQEFQQAVCDVLISKTLKAAKKFQPKTIMLAGGVSANQELRRQLGERIKNELSDTIYKIPDTKYSLDNATMIAAAAFFRYAKTSKKMLEENWKNLEASANLKLK